MYTNKEVLRQLNFLLKHQDAQLFQVSPTYIDRRNDDKSERKHDIILTENRTENEKGGMLAVSTVDNRGPTDSSHNFAMGCRQLAPTITQI